MAYNPVIKIIHTVFQSELANTFIFNNEQLTVVLPNHHQLLISAPCIKSKHHHAIPNLNSTQRHTYHYQYQQKHVSPNTRLTLHNLEECRIYLDDICHTFLNACIRDFEIIFSDGTTYLLLASEK